MTIPLYTELVAGPDDFVGAVAYSLYKQIKAEWITTYKANHGGADPTQAEHAAFHEFNRLPAQILGYQVRAEFLVSEFLAVGMQRRIDKITAETQRSALATKFETTHQSVANALALMRAEIARKRGFLGWSADVVTTLVVNILTIVVIGAIAIGADRLGAFNALLEKNLKPATPSVTVTPAPELVTPVQ